MQANDDASPSKWHLAHTTWFFEAFLLKRFLAGYRVFDERFEYCFNSYYESVGARQPRGKRGLLTRPSADEVRDYRAFVDQALARLLDTALAPEAAELIELGINHEQQHQELLLTDILSLFAAEPLKPAYREAAPGIGAGHATPLDWIDFEGGIFEVGHDGGGFAYDNEGPRHEALIHPFKLASRPVTNAEWIAFIEDGGYATPTLWLADGWNTVKSQAWEGPLYFETGRGRLRADEPDGLPPGRPRRAGHPCQLLRGRRLRPLGRLPAAHGIRVGGGVGERAGRWPHLGAGHLRPMPAGIGPRLQQMFGDVWEWTASAYLPYPGFKAAAGAVGEYNGKFMCNQFVLRGGSCATPEGHVRRSYRNFFYPHQRWQFTGLRLAAGA